MPASEPPEWALPTWETPDRRIAQPPSSRPEGSRAGAYGLTILSVSEVTRAVRDAVRSDARLHDVWVEGEVGRVTVSSAGHGYFSLQDARSQLACVFFRDDRIASPFQPQAGLRVVARGRVDVFDAQGVYQLYVASLQPAGFGDLALRFEALKARLAAEGLFDGARKRPLPIRPLVVAVVTSPSGAVWHDIQHVMERRWPLTHVLLVPCLVQGDPAPASIVAALDRVGRWIERCQRDGRPAEAPAVTILARGGGSLEDLWPFNDESVVRAVVRHPIPVVCGVGHEVDVTLADFAADVRAPTPSAAAELVTPDRIEMAGALAAQDRRLESLVRARIVGGARELAAERRALDRLNPMAQLAGARERAGVLLDRATRAIRRRIADGGLARERATSMLPILAGVRLATSRSSLEGSAAALAVLGPQATLIRGYAIVRRRSDGRIVREPAEAAAGTALAIRVARGELEATVDADRGGPGS